MATHSRLAIWLMAARPKTLAAALAPVLMGTALAYSDGAAHWPSALAALIGAFLIQIGTNFANDYYDFMKGTDDHARKGPLRAMQAGLLSDGQILRGMIAVFAMAFAVGGYLVWRGGWPIVWIGALSVASGILYTAGPYALAYLGLGDLFVLIFFGPVAVAGTYYVQALTLRSEVLVAGLAPGLFSMAVLAVNNLRDHEGDSKAGKRTLVVRLGPAFGKLEYFVAITLAALIPVYLFYRTGQHPWTLGAFVAGAVASLPAFRVVLLQPADGPAMNGALAQTCRALLIFSLIYSMGILL